MAREAGASVLLLESAPATGVAATRPTRNLRCMHDAPQDVLVDAYPKKNSGRDLLKVTGGLTNEHLARLVIRESSTCRDWMRSHGVHFQPPLSGALHVARTNAFFMGGGKALVNAYYRSAESWACRFATNRRWTASRSKTAALVAAHKTKERNNHNAKSCRSQAAGGFGIEPRMAALEAWARTSAANGPQTTS